MSVEILLLHKSQIPLRYLLRTSSESDSVMDLAFSVRKIVFENARST